jgi:hypothetical protein
MGELVRPRRGGWYDSAPLVLELRRCARRREQSIIGLAEELRIDRRTRERVLVKRSVRSDNADRISIALSRHPGELWPEWFS